MPSGTVHRRKYVLTAVKKILMRGCSLIPRPMEEMIARATGPEMEIETRLENAENMEEGVGISPQEMIQGKCLSE